MKIFDFEGVKSLIAEIKNRLASKQNAEPGKQLSEENFTAEDKEKLAVLSNYDDSEVREEIGSVKEQAALNRSAIGLQKKNLLKNENTDGIISGINIIIDDDGKINASGTTMSNFVYSIKKSANASLRFDKDVILSYTGSVDGANVRLKYNDGTDHYITLNTNREYFIPKQTEIIQVYIEQTETDKTVTVSDLAVMLRYAEITDNTYEPYRPSVAEYIANLETRISALENNQIIE